MALCAIAWPAPRATPCFTISPKDGLVEVIFATLDIGFGKDDWGTGRVFECKGLGIDCLFELRGISTGRKETIGFKFEGLRVPSV